MAYDATLKVGVDEKLIAQSIKRGMALGLGGKPLPLNIDTSKARLSIVGLTNEVHKFDTALSRANERVLAFGASAIVLGGTLKVLRDMAKSAIDVEAAFADINSVFQLTNAEMKQFGQGLFTISKQTGQSFKTVAEAAREFSRQGLDAVETTKRVRDAMILTRLSGLDLNKAVDGLTVALSAYRETGISTTQIVNKLVAVDRSFAISAGGLTEALSRVGSVAEDAGVSFEELVGMITAARQITGREASVIGNSLKTIFTRLERSDTIDKLEQVGLAVRDAAGNAKPALLVFKELAKNYDNMSRAQQQQVAELSAGVYQINQFKALLSDLGKAQGIAATATQIALRATNEAEIANEAYNKTLAAQIQILENSAIQVGSVFGEKMFGPAMKSLVNYSNQVLNFFSGIGQEGASVGEQIGEQLLNGLGAAIQGPGLALAFKLITGAAYSAFSTIGKELIGFGEIGGAIFKKQESTLLGINKLLEGATNEERALFFSATQVAEQENLILGILQRQNAERNKQLGAVGAFMTGSPTMARQIRTGKSVTPTAAEGAFGAINAESLAISRGAGGATPAAKPVLIKNFAVGGGVTTPIVANTDEWLVSNFAGTGGGAIFNRNMVAAHGLPAGAKRIVPNMADGGFVPISRGSVGDVNSGYLKDVNAKLAKLHNASSWDEYKSIYNSLPDTKNPKLAKAITQAATSASIALGERSTMAKETEKVRQLAAISSISSGVGGAGLPFGGIQAPSNYGANWERNAQNLKAFTSGSPSLAPSTLSSGVSLGNLGKFSLGKAKISGVGEYSPLTLGQFAAQRKELAEKASEVTKQLAQIGNISSAVGAGNLPFSGVQAPSNYGANWDAQAKTARFMAFSSGAGLAGYRGFVSPSTNELVGSLSPRATSTADLAAMKMAGDPRYKDALHLSLQESAQRTLSNRAKAATMGGTPTELNANWQLERAYTEALQHTGKTDTKAQEYYAYKEKSLREDAQRQVKELALQEEVQARNAQIALNERKELARKERNAKWEKRSTNLQMLGLAASFGSGMLPTGAGGTGSGMGWGAASGALQGLGTGAIAGSIAGPIGTAIGAGVGAIGGALIGLFSKSTKSIEEIGAEVDESLRQSAKRISDLSSYSQSLGEYQDALKNPNASKTYIANILNRQREASQGLTAEQMRIVASGSEEERAKLFEDEQKKITTASQYKGLVAGLDKSKTKDIAQGITGLSGLGDKDVLGLISKMELASAEKQPRQTDMLGNFLSGHFGGSKSEISTRQYQEYRKSVEETVINSLSGLEEDQVKEIQSRIEKMGDEELQNLLFSLRGTIKEKMAKIAQAEKSDKEQKVRGNIYRDLSKYSSAISSTTDYERFALAASGQRQRSQFGLNAFGKGYSSERMASMEAQMDIDITTAESQQAEKERMANLLEGFSTQLKGSMSIEDLSKDLKAATTSEDFRNIRLKYAGGDKELSESLNKLIITEDRKVAGVNLTLQQLIKRKELADLVLKEAEQKASAYAPVQAGLFKAETAYNAKMFGLGQKESLLEENKTRNYISEAKYIQQKAALMSEGSTAQMERGISEATSGARAAFRTLSTNQQPAGLKNMNLDGLKAWLGSQKGALNQDTINSLNDALNKAEAGITSATNENTKAQEEANRLMARYQTSFSGGFKEAMRAGSVNWQELGSVGAKTFDSLQSNMTDMWANFVTGAQSGTTAFRSFITGVLSDASRAFASKAVQAMMFSAGEWAFGSSFMAGAKASGGGVTSMLTGGEYVFTPEQAKKLGPQTLKALNGGYMEKFANGGVVKGGSGYKDDVMSSLRPGSYVIKKASVQKYGAENLQAIANGQAQHRFIGGMIIPMMLAGAGVGYLTGGKKGALIGAGLGLVGGMAANYMSSSGSAWSYGASGTPAATSAQAAASTPEVGSKGYYMAQQQASVAQTATSAPMPAWKMGLYGLGASAVLGIGSALLTDKERDYVPMSSAQIEQRRLSEESKQSVMGGGKGQSPILQINPQGGYSLLGYGYTPATRRFASGGGLMSQFAGSPNVASFASGGEVASASVSSRLNVPSTNISPAMMGGFASGGSNMSTGAVMPSLPSSPNGSTSSSASGANISITINDNRTSSEAEGQGSISPDEAKMLGKMVEAKVNEMLSNSLRNGGILRNQGRILSPVNNA
jgi:TP901 family phage tail tape measure protein